MSDDSLAKWLAAIERRGHSGMFARPSKGDQRVVERQTVEEWAHSVEAEELHKVSDIRSSDRDPPDCIAFVDGVLVAIELSELLNGRILHKISSARKSGGLGPTFAELQWDRSLFERYINEIFAAKSRKLLAASKRFPMSFLIIHTDEPWLTPEQVKEWIGLCKFRVPANIDVAYLLQTYVPGYADYWPVFRLV